MDCRHASFMTLKSRVDAGDPARLLKSYILLFLNAAGSIILQGPTTGFLPLLLRKRKQNCFTVKQSTLLECEFTRHSTKHGDHDIIVCAA